MIERGKLLKEPFEKCFADLLFNLKRAKRDYCNIDLDGYNKKRTLRIAKELKKLSFVKDVKIFRNIESYKHYHLLITFNRLISMDKIILLRLLFNDHPERLRLDLIRMLNGFFDWTVDYIANLGKFKIDLETKKVLERISNYKQT